MEREKKRTLALITIIGVIIIGSVFYFIWGNFISKGKMLITADPIFEVQILGGEKITCTVSPCEITQKPGILDIVVEKEGYKTVLEEVEIELWKTTDLNINFEVIPYILKSENSPIPEKEIKYEIIFDEETKMYKLVNSGDAQERTIVFFQNKIKDPQFFGSEKAVLIVDKSSNEKIAYKIDLITKSRESITGFGEISPKNIVEGIWSDDGENFAFKTSDSDYLLMIDSNNQVKTLEILKENSKYAWISLGSLVFMAPQESAIDTRVGKYGSSYINLIGSVSDIGYMFGMYHPDEDSYTKIEIFSFSEIPKTPDIFIPAGNGRIIYFRIGEENYKLVF